MRKKQFLIIITFLLCFIPFVDVKAVTSTNYETGSNGDGLDVSGSSASCSTSQGCEHTSNYGVRVTLVDVDGKIIKGTHFVDFWNNIPTNARAKNGSTYRSAYVNSSNYAGASSESFGAVGSYAKGNVTNDLTLIGGSINNESQHTLIEGVIRDELEKYKNSGDCSELKFFDYFGYTDFCSMLTF